MSHSSVRVESTTIGTWLHSRKRRITSKPSTSAQFETEDENVGTSHFNWPQCFGRGRRLAHPEAVLWQGDPKEAPDPGIGLDNEGNWGRTPR